MTPAIDIDIVHPDAGFEIHEQEGIDGLVIAVRNTETLNSFCADIPELAAICHGIRLYMARQGIGDDAIENIALQWREANPVSEEAG